MRKQQYRAIDLVCLKCGNVTVINHRAGKLMNVGYIRDMYCLWCEKKVKFFEVRDVSSFMWEYSNKGNLTEEEELVISLLMERKGRNVQSEVGIHKKALTRK